MQRALLQGGFSIGGIRACFCIFRVTSRPKANQEDFASIPIPAGKIFVIETVAFTIFATQPVDRLVIVVPGTDISGSPDYLQYDLVVPPPNPGGRQVGIQALRLYARPVNPIGLGVALEVVSTDTKPQTASVFFSGYFVSQ
jgi:hypothetical protein